MLQHISIIFVWESDHIIIFFLIFSNKGFTSCHTWSFISITRTNMKLCLCKVTMHVFKNFFGVMWLIFGQWNLEIVWHEQIDCFMYTNVDRLTDLLIKLGRHWSRWIWSVISDSSKGLNTNTQTPMHVNMIIHLIFPNYLTWCKKNVWLTYIYRDTPNRRS